jgi:hypothetical protein
MKPSDLLLFQKDDFSAAAEGQSDDQSRNVQIAQLSWEPWGGERLAILFHTHADVGGNTSPSRSGLGKTCDCSRHEQVI